MKIISILQQVLRVLLGLAMLTAGISHLTFLREEFQAQVPMWLANSTQLMDIVVVASGIVEIMFGVLFIVGGKYKTYYGLALAIFFVLIFPGNINQYVHEIDAFGLDTNQKRFVRLLFQPVLVIWALWSTMPI